MFRMTLMGILGCALAAPLHAGELHLVNGAAIPGDIVRIEHRHVVWRADLIGEIRVSKADVAALESEAHANLRILDGAGVRTDCGLDGESAALSVTCGGSGPAVVALADIQAAAPPRQRTGTIMAGIDIEHGNNESADYDVDARANWRVNRLRHATEASIDYETQGDDETSDETELSYQLDYLLREGWFVFARIDYYRNDFSSMKEAKAISTGFGRDVVFMNGAYLSAQIGFAEAVFNLEGIDPGLAREFDDDLSDYRTEAGITRWRGGWKTPWRQLEVFHEGEFNWLLESGSVNRLETRSGVRMPLFERLLAELRYDFDHIGIRADGGKNTDTEWVMALGVQW